MLALAAATAAVLATSGELSLTRNSISLRDVALVTCPELDENAIPIPTKVRGIVLRQGAIWGEISLACERELLSGIWIASHVRCVILEAGPIVWAPSGRRKPIDDPTTLRINDGPIASDAALDDDEDCCEDEAVREVFRAILRKL